MSRISSFEHYQNQYKASIENPENFWSAQAEEFVWKKKWNRVLNWNFEEPKVEWFIGGQLNITENCLDRHLTAHGDQIAFYWEPNDPTEKAVQITYSQLHEQVCKFANVLKKNGVKKGDRVCIYMPMVLELTVAVLACARIGAVHSVVFGGFSANALADRIKDCICKVVITSNVAVRGSKTISLKEVVDEAVQAIDFVEKVIVYERKEGSTVMKKGRDLWWHEEMNTVTADCAAETMDAEDLLFILYTSGSTGKPKGVVHTCGGYMVYTQYTFENVFQYNKEKKDIYWCTADVGWITGHSYIVYGPLLTGATSVMFEGIPTFPDAGRFWQIVDKYNVSIFYTAPTAIRALEAAGTQYVTPYKLNSLRILGSVGEPINEEAWHWYNEHIGQQRCPIVDTWWQTETGGIMISPLAGITKTKPSFATLPLPGVQPILVDDKGKEIIGNGVEGNLCIKFPWPSIIRTTYGDHKRCKETYFSTYKNLYFTGDGCKRDEDGYYRITGRVDDVMNISGHRIGTAEVESAINMHADIVESAVVGYPHDIKGQGIYAYVISINKAKNQDVLRQEILSEIIKSIGPIAKPDKIQVVSGLPKTRSGKIMRRILRKIAEGDVSNLGDTSTLLEPAIVEEIINGAIHLR
ncbi:MAG TPA: acetate--CoA ligase [Bacteroidia bacterium]|nr:acetate--CoA ligase [Bacteroidia bacterium]